jgi:LysR family hydrogen peroxide-inducible transcriptional activator
VALADERHFGRAAGRCFVSQPTLSAQIRKLERYLGVSLVERQPRRVALTPAGQEVVVRARRVLQESDAIVELAQSARDPLGVLALPVVPMDGLESTVLYEEPFSLAVPDSHRLAARKRVGIDDLRDETLLLLEDGHCLRDQALEVCSRVDVHEAQDYRATSLETLRQMVAAGHGVTLLPELAIAAPIGATRGLEVRPFDAPAPSRTIGAVWRKSTTRSAAIEAIADTVRAVLREDKNR